jgi:SPP1 family predicted phage head-tail adaptor
MLTRLPHRIIVQTLASTTATTGGTFEETYADTFNRWANVQTKKASENFRFEKDSQTNQYTIKMRKEPFTNKMRLKFNDKILRIQSVSDPTFHNNMIIIEAFEELT